MPVLTGLFAISELLHQAGATASSRPAHWHSTRSRLPTRADFRKCAKAIGLSSVLGTFIGILPALGATTAALISYNETKRWSKHKDEFGKGAIEGVAGPEAANNAAVGGSMVPTLALGIPGSATTAIILAGLIVQGVRPGPHLFNEQPTLLYAVFASMLAANLHLSRARAVRGEALRAHHAHPRRASSGRACSSSRWSAPTAPTSRWSMSGSCWASACIGFLLRRFGFSPAPLVMGLVLGTMVGGDAEAVAADLRPELAAVLLTPDRRGAVRDHRRSALPPPGSRARPKARCASPRI